jgi:hypothetical protein
MTHRIIPLVLQRSDGLIEYRCLTCDRPVAKIDRGWKHYRYAVWHPRKAA